MTFNPQQPIKLTGKHYLAHQAQYHQWMRDTAPVCKGKLYWMDAYLVSRYDDCNFVLKDPRFVRNRTTATGGGRLPITIPIPMPKTLELLSNNMVTDDDPNHRRLKNLVHQAFLPRSIEKMHAHLDNYANALLDKAEAQGEVDLITAYSSLLPAEAITRMLGVEQQEAQQLQAGINSLTKNFSGFGLIKGLLWHLPRMTKFTRQLIARKRHAPGDDILTQLIQAEDAGDQLSEDELVTMVFLLIIAGVETTVHLINNAVITLLQHPEQLQLLREQPELIDSAIEEVQRFNGPIGGTKPNYAMEDVSLQGVTIPKGAMVLTLLSAANHDPTVFADPEVFDITRSPNRHMSFGMGIHYCLGASLARLEVKIALNNLLQRHPNLRLAVPVEQLEKINLPLQTRYRRVPVILG